jgi:hypothetical protein
MAVSTKTVSQQQMLTFDKPLGGSFGTVYKAIDTGTGEIVAIKHVCDLSKSLTSLIES